MEKGIFTIVAKNYIPLATILGDSIQKIHPDINFVIFVADNEDGVVDFSKQKYEIINTTELPISDIDNLAFKYNLTEFCTALKPFCFEYLFSKGWEKVIYFDPDIFVYSSLDCIYDKLEQYSIVLTPHYVLLEENYSGFLKEGLMLHAGVYNLGFTAISNSKDGRSIISWWKNRLIDGSYIDKIDGFFTDQKWMNILPAIVDSCYVDRGLGLNVAIWNAHERKVLVDEDGTFFVENRIGNVVSNERLVFFHFSNFSFSKADDYSKFYHTYLKKYEDFNLVARLYSDAIIKSDFLESLSLYSYSYNTFENGLPITHFHRRLFRRLTEEGISFENPFVVSDQAIDSFFYILKENNLLIDDASFEKVTELTVGNLDRKLKIINLGARMISKIIGFKRYSMLCKFALRYFRPENQVFLLNKSKFDLKFLGR